MKRFLVLALVGLLFVLILVAILWKALGPSASPKQPQGQQNAPTVSSDTTFQTPEEAVKSCLAWYGAAYGPDSTVTQDALDAGNSACFTNDFVDSWNTIFDDAQSDPVLIGWDGVSPAPAVASVSVVNRSGMSAVVRATFAAGSSVQPITLTLERTQTGWLIRSVVPAN